VSSARTRLGLGYRPHCTSCGCTTSCELLKHVREKPALLLPDPSAEVRAFRLTASAPMGTKRNGLRKAFVPGVEGVEHEGQDDEDDVGNTQQAR